MLTYLRPALAVVLAAALGLATYVAFTAGMRALLSGDDAGAVGTMPRSVYNAPPSVPTTAEYGPVGAVSLVFAGTEVQVGLTGGLENPWIAVSSRSGAYRALSAPDLPDAAPGAISVSPDGTALAWGFAEGVVVYDTTDDSHRRIGANLGADPVVGPFSPDGARLLVYDGEAHVVDVRTGDVLATLGGLDARAARQAVWTPDGRAVSFVDAGRLVVDPWQSDADSRLTTSISERATLAWSPSGDLLAAMSQARGVRSVEVFELADGKATRRVHTVSPDGYAQQQLLGFTGERTVAVSALTLESGPIPVVYEMSAVDDAPPAQLTLLAGEGSNWVGPETLAVAAEPLARGSTDYDEPLWPWSALSRLVASTLVALFLLGLYLTRRPRRH